MNIIAIGATVCRILVISLDIILGKSSDTIQERMDRLNQLGRDLDIALNVVLFLSGGSVLLWSLQNNVRGAISFVVIALLWVLLEVYIRIRLDKKITEAEYILDEGLGDAGWYDKKKLERIQKMQAIPGGRFTSIVLLMLSAATNAYFIYLAILLY